MVSLAPHRGNKSQASQHVSDSPIAEVNALRRPLVKLQALGRPLGLNGRPCYIDRVRDACR